MLSHLYSTLTRLHVIVALGSREGRLGDEMRGGRLIGRQTHQLFRHKLKSYYFR